MIFLYISILDENYNMKKLLKHLEKFEDVKLISFDLEKFENRLHADIHGSFGTNDKNYLRSNVPRRPSLTEENHKEEIQIINNGLCIIINQMYFGEEVYIILIFILKEIIVICISFY